MKTMHQKKQEDSKNSISSVVASVAGAVVIAGVAVATKMALKDDKTREKVKKVFTNVKDQAIDYVDKLKTESNSKKTVQTIKKVVAGTKKLAEKSN